MNEFIIWDERYRVFRKLLKIDFELGLYFCIDTVVPFEKGELVKNIGLKDINGKSIYSDCSIVEFEYTRAIKCDIEKRVCYFVYCNHSLKYWLKFVGDVGTFEFDLQQCKNFKIIDTIQENKLGLIKA